MMKNILNLSGLFYRKRYPRGLAVFASHTDLLVYCQQPTFKLLFKYQYSASFIILYYDLQMHNYFTNYHTPICFDTIMSSSGSLKLISCQVTQVFKRQLLVMQFTIKKFHTGFMQYDSTINIQILYTTNTQADVLRIVATK